MSSNNPRRVDEKVGVVDFLGIVIRRGDGSVEEIDLSPPKITKELLEDLLEEMNKNGMDEERNN